MKSVLMDEYMESLEKPLHRKKIMLVEDDEEIGKWLVKKLDESINESNFNWKRNLKDATAELSKNHAEIIILDLKLPDGNGVDLLKKIKNEKLKISVYVFSANSEFKNTCLRLGAHRFFDKTSESELLIKEIKNAV